MSFKYNFNFKFNLRNKIIVSIIIFLLFMISIIYFIFLPTVKDILTIRESIELERFDLEKKYLRGQSLRRLSEKLVKIEEQISILDQVFINENRGLEFITTLEDVASKNNISQKINLLSPLEPDNNFYQKTPIQLYTQGSINNQMNYLVGLETLNYYLNINTIEISSSLLGQNTFFEAGGGNVNMIIFADTYWRY